MFSFKRQNLSKILKMFVCTFTCVLVCSKLKREKDTKECRKWRGLGNASSREAILGNDCTGINIIISWKWGSTKSSSW